MATFDLTAKSTTGVGANSIAALPSHVGTHMPQTIQEYLDIDALIAAGNSIADGDVFQMLEIPAGCLVLNAGAEVMKAFTSSCTLDMDFGGGDDIIDGADITSVYYLVPNAVNAQFTGRTEICQRLGELVVTREYADLQQRFVLYGMGGSGKTQICLKFAEACRTM